jgi:hypothetical protein
LVAWPEQKWECPEKEGIYYDEIDGTSSQQFFETSVLIHQGLAEYGPKSQVQEFGTGRQRIPFGKVLVRPKIVVIRFTAQADKLEPASLHLSSKGFRGMENNCVTRGRKMAADCEHRIDVTGIRNCAN